MTQKIVILGCGLSGMLTALAYAKSNVETIIIERNGLDSQEFYDDVRTTALTKYSQCFLKNMNIWQYVSRIATEILDVYVVDNKAPEILHLSNEKSLCKGGMDNNLGYIVKNSEFKKILAQQIKSHPLITVFDKCTYKEVKSYLDHSVISFENRRDITCDLVIVCDGYRSKARQYYFSSKIEKHYQQTALAFNVVHEKAHENCAIEHFMPLGPFAVLPLIDQYASSIVWSTSDEQASSLINLPRMELEHLVHNNIGKSLGKVTLGGDIRIFPLKAYITNKYFYNRIVLVADSAHIIHPLAGQGLNQGIKDIETLVMLTSTQINATTLENYQKLREGDNYAMYMITDILNVSFSNYSEYANYIRRIGLKVLDNCRPIKVLLTRYAMGEK